MKTRKLTKDDLPSYRRSAKSLGIPVLFQGREDFDELVKVIEAELNKTS